MTRLTYAIVTTAAVSLIGVASIASFAPRLIWNASASTPVGFYTIGDVGALDVTDLVAVDAPEPLATFLSDGGYLPRGVPLLKRVAAVPGVLRASPYIVYTVQRELGGRSQQFTVVGYDLFGGLGGNDQVVLVNLRIEVSDTPTVVGGEAGATLPVALGNVVL